MTWTFGRVRAAAAPYFGWHRLHTLDDGLAFVVAIPLAATLCSVLVVPWILATPWTHFVIDQPRMLGALAVVSLFNNKQRLQSMQIAPILHHRFSGTIETPTISAASA